jgi:hypothetical protein
VTLDADRGLTRAIGVWGLAAAVLFFFRRK